MMDKNSGDFKKLAADMMPVIKDMEDVLKKHGIDDLATITMDTNGYFTFSYTGAGRDFSRICEDDTPKVRTYYIEEL